MQSEADGETSVDCFAKVNKLLFNKTSSLVESFNIFNDIQKVYIKSKLVTVLMNFK